MKARKEHLFSVLLAVAVVSALAIGRDKPTAKAPPTPEQVAMNECAANAFSQHLKDSQAIAEQQTSTLTKGEDGSSLILIARREKEAACFRRVECYKPTEMQRGLMFDSCLKEEL